MLRIRNRRGHKPVIRKSIHPLLWSDYNSLSCVIAVLACLPRQIDVRRFVVHCRTIRGTCTLTVPQYYRCCQLKVDETHRPNPISGNDRPKIWYEFHQSPYIIFGEDFSRACTRACARVFACTRGWIGGSVIRDIFQRVKI